MSQAMCRSCDCGLRTGAGIPWVVGVGLDGSLQAWHPPRVRNTQSIRCAKSSVTYTSSPLRMTATPTTL